MPHSSSRLRGLGLVGLAALASLAAAPSAGAVGYTVDAQCTFPLIGDQPVTIGIDVPVSVAPGASVVPLTVTSFTGSALSGLRDARVKATLTASVALPSGGARLTKAAVTYPVKAPVAADPVDLVGEEGQATVVYTGLSGQLSSTWTTPQPDPDSDGDPSALDIPCALPVGNLSYPKIQIGDADNFAPSRPGPLTFEPAGPGAVKVNWGASTDNVGVAGYVLTVDGVKRADVAAPNTSYTITGLEPGAEVEVGVSAVDVNGNVSQESTGSVVVGGVIVDPYGVPVNLRATQTTTSVTLTWGVDLGFEPPAFVVYQDDVKIQTLSDTHQTTITGLTPGQTYAFKVASTDGDLVLGTTAPLRVTLPATPRDSFAWDLAGSASIKTLIKGSVPLKGGLGVDIDAAGAVIGDLTLEESSARLTALGFLPLTAKIAFVASGRTTGTYAAGVLKTKSSMRIKVTQAKLFGALPIVTGNTCQTRKLSDINLTSAAGFSLGLGGTLAGQFAMSDLNGCGGLNGMVSSLTSGSGNTITLQATPAAPQAN